MAKRNEFHSFHFYTNKELGYHLETKKDSDSAFFTSAKWLSFDSMLKFYPLNGELGFQRQSLWSPSADGEIPHAIVLAHRERGEKCDSIPAEWLLHDFLK